MITLSLRVDRRVCRGEEGPEGGSRGIERRAVEGRSGWWMRGNRIRGSFGEIENNSDLSLTPTLTLVLVSTEHRPQP